eukprot:scaffold598765_cov19-Prasinocladus_malaysianus.AAC.1
MHARQPHRRCPLGISDPDLPLGTPLQERWPLGQRGICSENSRFTMSLALDLMHNQRQAQLAASMTPLGLRKL